MLRRVPFGAATEISSLIASASERLRRTQRVRPGGGKPFQHRVVVHASAGSVTPESPAGAAERFSEGVTARKRAVSWVSPAVSELPPRPAQVRPDARHRAEPAGMITAVEESAAPAGIRQVATYEKASASLTRDSS